MRRMAHGQSREALTQTLAEWLCWQAARRVSARGARRLCYTSVVEGEYCLDEEARLDDFSLRWRELSRLARRADGTGARPHPATRRFRCRHALTNLAHVPSSRHWAK
jgi:hypothetical protein